MGLTEDFRRNAHDCLQWAKEAGTAADQAMWLGMAQFWLRLAQFVEEQDSRQNTRRTAEPPQNGEHSPDQSKPSD